jgi:hypothetical protein
MEDPEARGLVIKAPLCPSVFASLFREDKLVEDQQHRVPQVDTW